MDKRYLFTAHLSSNAATPKAKIDERKRLLYLLASLIASPSIYFVWRLYGDSNVFIRYIYLFLLAEVVLWTGALLWRRIPLIWIEGFVLITIGLFYLAKYTYFLYFENPYIAWKEIETISSGTIILFILAYIILHHRHAFRFSLVYTALILAIGFWRFLPNEMSQFLELIRFGTRLIVIALLTFALAKSKDDLLPAQKLAAYWEWQANLDHLTQLPNRRMLSTLLEQRLLEKKHFAILLIDIDGFKGFNDTYGHDVGDMIIGHVAFVLKTNLRGTDIVARWGGEEFLVLVNETKLEQAFQLAERLRGEVEKLEFDENQISVSIGGTFSKSLDDLSSLLKRADVALYTAKDQGRNCVRWE